MVAGMSTPNICFVDCETTGLHPDRHQIWEVALITPDDREHVWQFPITELEADPFALNIGGYWERAARVPCGITSYDAIFEAHNDKSRFATHPLDAGTLVWPNEEWCRYFQRLTAGYHLAGAVVSFDEERLRRLLERNGVLHRWHYHVVDVEALAAGRIASAAPVKIDMRDVSAAPPWKSDDLSRAVGVNPEDFDRHTALGDARWARAIYRAVME